MTTSARTVFYGGIAASLLMVTAASAHHGWSWAEDQQVELSGTIKAIMIAPPHPTLDVETADDGLWRVELGNPRATERAGFVEGVAKVGDMIVALGNKSKDPSEKRMKAVRITIGDKVYDIYPERIESN
ncbi:MAG: hypothetical protein JWM58_1301 [Rhizobium sp.]|nr:hypothetical protein [Rhizobium sp.]